MKTDSISITDQPIDYAAITEQVRSNECGAVVLFMGTVREMTAGKQTVALDYEAYPEMADQMMQQLIDEARDQWDVHGIAIEHRVGHLTLGEISVAIAVSSAHRSEAFEAGRFLIDRLKEIVPIWKKENWSDGTTEWEHPEIKAK
ncbi:molybdenum cofactor biosynthesis protein MoaE [Gimesia maris]|jgi:molybdopterin synthase catalytic subunit|uniref:Molybdopterin synthase catalytic subunit n=1 Tax=Gimesia maris TaxID=122 RepID=A0ABX5YUG8_9PLAN|nr:molybdenum cofactor biosynthesis protein MoaE [Gimesia maris]MAC52478.1 molybdopterin converting factor [Gimesia sp.]EDL61513.1 molybdopterin converting factor (subunit 2) [Gimesia maris DSM 8797]QDT81671.1 Molybdopterin synthase catalytic subunit [Gimesia maris]QDU17391.1 Molybdopterin synthase catalytic subunit [Gimesia maris]QEG19454.1 Molybdopterin synthase catalytic subunit [Gimesia maris]|tara:strand:+ start:44020 stop:44454 length:435 start_codon:yes stop_codon:yes gene_type:complete